MPCPTIPGRSPASRRARALRDALPATVPCDSPNFPDDLVARLADRLDAEGAEIAIAATREDGELACSRCSA
jgi:molybdopterin-guanine dinucleotide biosynthesis protein A